MLHDMIWQHFFELLSRLWHHHSAPFGTQYAPIATWYQSWTMQYESSDFKMCIYSLEKWIGRSYVTLMAFVWWLTDSFMQGTDARTVNVEFRWHDAIQSSNESKLSMSEAVIHQINEAKSHLSVIIYLMDLGCITSHSDTHLKYGSITRVTCSCASLCNLINAACVLYWDAACVYPVVTPLEWLHTSNRACDILSCIVNNTCVLLQESTQWTSLGATSPTHLSPRLGLMVRSKCNVQVGYDQLWVSLMKFNDWRNAETWLNVRIRTVDIDWECSFMPQ